MDVKSLSPRPRWIFINFFNIRMAFRNKMYVFLMKFVQTNNQNQCKRRKRFGFTDRVCAVSTVDGEYENEERFWRRGQVIVLFSCPID